MKRGWLSGEPSGPRLTLIGSSISIKLSSRVIALARHERSRGLYDRMTTDIWTHLVPIPWLQLHPLATKTETDSLFQTQSTPLQALNALRLPLLPPIQLSLLQQLQLLSPIPRQSLFTLFSNTMKQPQIQKWLL